MLQKNLKEIKETVSYIYHMRTVYLVTKHQIVILERGSK